MDELQSELQMRFSIILENKIEIQLDYDAGSFFNGEMMKIVPHVLKFRPEVLKITLIR